MIFREGSSSGRSLGAIARRWVALGFAAAAVLIALAGCGGGGDRISAPTINTQPADLAVAAGATASFSVVATGGAPLGYQWHSSADGTSFAPVGGANAAGYSVATTPALNGAHFRVVVSNSAGSVTSAAARLTVTAATMAPAIAMQPADETVPVGARPVFSVRVSGEPPPSLQWQRSVDGGSNWSDIPGAGASEYAPGPVASGDDGARFRVQAGNSEGTVFSDAARLSVWNTSSADLCTDSDGGTWCSLSPKPQGNHLNGIARVGGTVMVAVGNDGVIIRSSDAGQSWQPVQRATFRKLNAVAFGDSNVGVAVGSIGTMLRTQDGGLTWEPLRFVTGNELYAVAFANANVAVAIGAAHTILRSVDGGRNWNVVTGVPPAQIGSGLAFNEAGVGVLTGWPMLRTTDAGATWTAVEGERPQATTSVAFASADRAVAVGTLSMQTSDAGLSWQNYAGSLSPSDVTAVAFGEQGIGAAVSNYHSRLNWIFRTTDGGVTWSRPTSIPAGVLLNAVAFSAANVAVAVGQFGVIIRSTDGGATWTEASSRPLGSLTPQSVAFARASTGFAVGYGGIMRTADGGRSWEQASSASPAYLFGVAALAGSTQAVAVGQSGTILRSIDAGRSWTAAVAPPLGFEGCIVITGTICPGDAQRLLAVAFADTNAVVAVGRGGRITRSADGGQTWNAIDSPVTATLNAIGFADNGIGLAVGDAGTIIRTNDGGRSWSKVAGGIAGRLFSVAFASPQLVVVGGESGAIARSVDGGLNWEPSFGASSESAVVSIAWSESGVGIAAATFTQTIDGRSEQRLILLRSIDGGQIWRSGPNFPFASGRVVFTGPSAALVLADHGEVWISTNAGQ